MQSIGIIGTGLAGLRCAAELRAAGFTGTMYAWDGEGRDPYDRPPLSKELFGDYEHPLADDGLGDFDELAVAVIPRAAAHITSGTTWRVDSQCVDALVIATGAAPHSTLPGAKVLYTLDDAKDISTAITPDSTVHIVGAGWIERRLPRPPRSVVWRSRSGRSFHPFPGQDFSRHRGFGVGPLVR